ncbi:PspA/IM30 family protein [Gloeobacter kilaueensis]|uniref:Exodeoxyribonuclease VII large subunit n=1 Tax=Gloeobacter kilaueensis (strain ATCC BAA-2537 / CCAP 1431/1 / ULC 316 / JS1) TaxID=1183438 RepID=U5QCP1_GLOK1|nr:PspA/IM30 family protein [Gloeobacter kilaueensis]AGY56613.1 exodeoxyribonuclease VII large subunit [Gloeobacter kilaueensis JS1]
MSRSGRKSFVYWLFGERAGRVVVGFWNWLWGRPVEEGGNMSVKVAEQAYRDIQASVQRLTEAVATQVSAYRRAQQLYQQKVKEYQSYEQQALTAKKQDRLDLARQALSKALAIEQILPELQERVQKAEEYANAARARLEKEQQQLEDYKSRLQNLKDLNEINNALATMAQVSNEYNIDSARSQFEEANAAVQRKKFQVEALNELSESASQKAEDELKQLSADSELDRRLEALGQPSNPPLQLPVRESERQSEP